MRKKLGLGRDVADCTIISGYAYHIPLGFSICPFFGCTFRYPLHLIAFELHFQRLNRVLA